MRRVRGLAFAMLGALGSACAGGSVYDAAGLLPYSRHDGALKVLLGCEPRKDRGGEVVWTDFIGKLDPTDLDARDTAAREFSEETRGAYTVPEIEAWAEAADARVMVDDKVLVFLTEVRWIPADSIEQRPTALHTGKQRYCWVELGELLARIDAAGEGLARVPAHCGAEPRALYDAFQRNLVRGTPLRFQLDELPQP